MSAEDETGGLKSAKWTALVLVTTFSFASAVGWLAGEILKWAGYTHRIEAVVVGGGSRSTIYPIAGEWYGAMLGPVALFLALGSWYFFKPWEGG